MLRRKIMVPVIALAVLALTTACSSPTPSPTEQPTPASTPAPNPTPTPETPVAEGITITTERIVVVDAAGDELASFDYFQPTDTVVAGLSAYLGAPVDTPFEGRNDVPAATYHDWGDLRLVDTVPDGEPPYTPEHWVRATGIDANGLAIRAVDGTLVGDPIDAISGEYSDFTNPSSGLTTRYIRMDLVDLPPMNGSDELNFATAVYGSVDDNRVDAIIAPSANFGA
ncbi:hypothetical protein [Agromyces sp. NPDC055658]